MKIKAVVHNERFVDKGNYRIRKLMTIEGASHVDVFGEDYVVRVDWKAEYIVRIVGRKAVVKRFNGKTFKVKTIYESLPEQHMSAVEKELRNDYAQVSRTNDNLFVVRKYVDYIAYDGVTDENGKIILPCEYHFSSEIPRLISKKKNRIVFSKNGKCGVMNFAGEIVLEPRYLRIEEVYAEPIVVFEDSTRCVVTENGELICCDRSDLSLAATDDKIIYTYLEEKRVEIYQISIKEKKIVERRLVTDIPDNKGFAISQIGMDFVKCLAEKYGEESFLFCYFRNNMLPILRKRENEDTKVSCYQEMFPVIGDNTQSEMKILERLRDIMKKYGL